MTQKIYGVLNLIDWTVGIKAGKATLRVHFTGGATTARGQVPATYSTADPVKQAIIEKSNYFKTGYIYVVQVIEMPDDAAEIARKAQRASRASKTHEAEAKPVDSEAVKSVEVSSLDDAKEYLKDNFDVSSSKLRTRAAILEQAKANGIEFVGI